MPSLAADPDADFRIGGMYKVNEYFVEYLHATIACGGFRGRVEPVADDESPVAQFAPRLHLLEVLARDLMAV